MDHHKVSQYLSALSSEAEEALRGGETDLALVVDDLATYCNQLVSDQDISFAAAAVFDKDHGVVSMVDRLRISRERAVHKAREKCLSFLGDFLRLIGRERAFLYVSFVKDQCIRILRVDETRSVQAAALAPLIALFEVGVLREGQSDATMDWKTAELLLAEFRKAKTSGSLKSSILITLGYSIEYFPSRFEESNVSSVLKLTLGTLEDQLKQSGRDIVFVLIAGAVKCLDSLLQWFDETVPAGGTVDNSRKAYACLEQVLYYREDMKRYEMIRAGLRLLARHAWRFRLALFKNCTDIFGWLQTYCTHNNASLRSAALPAYDQFISQISSCLIYEDQRLEDPARTYTALMKHSLGIMDSRTDNPKLVALAIRAIGKLSGAVIKYSGKDDLEKAFQRLIPFAGSYTRGGDAHEELGYAVTVVGAFANMVVYLERVEDFMISLITEVTGRIFYQYPTLFTKQKFAVYTTISSLFKALYTKGNLFTMFLMNVVWSSLERGTEGADPDNLGSPLWKRYAELWCELLDYTGKREHRDPLSDEESQGVVGFDLTEKDLNQKELQKSLFDSIIRGIMKSMMELNLKYRVKRTDNMRQMELSEQEVEPDTETAIEPLDKSQMLKYLNLVEFTLYLLASDHARLMVNWILPFSSCVIGLSRKYPLISGFYKLLAAVIRIGDREGYFDNDQSGAHAMIKQFLGEVLTSSRRYKLELLASCLHLCLSSPPCLLDLVSLLRPVKLALKLGLRYTPLANIALDVLERWHSLYPAELQKHIHEVVPCLGDYLFEKAAEKIDAKTLKILKEEKTKVVDFEAVQVRVQQFLGKVGAYAHFLVPDINVLQASGTGGLAWDVHERVKFTIPLRDEKLDVWLDRLLPRLVELANSSSDRRTKVMASELFHAVCLLMLGNAAKGPLRSRNDDTHLANYVQIYRKIFPSILRLATDVEQVNQQLFSEFSVQLIHWMTSNTQKENPETMALLDAILDGLVDSDNGSLREFCAICFTEFMRWSIRHAPPEVNNFVNVTSMLRRLYNRMDHPSPYHRLGAAMAAYQIYPILRENSSIVDRHAFEITFFLVKSLRVGDSDVDQIGTKKQASRALDGLQRLIIRNISSLQKTRKDRMLFSTLEDFMQWLLDQTKSHYEACRSKCMSFLSSVCNALPAGSSASWFREKYNGSQRQRILEDLFPDHFLEELFTRGGMNKLSTGMHWLQWCLSLSTIEVDEVLLLRTRIFSPIRHFVKELPGKSVRSKDQDRAIVHLVALIKAILQLSNDSQGSTLLSEMFSEILPVEEVQRLLCLLLFQAAKFVTLAAESRETEELRTTVSGVLMMLNQLSTDWKAGLVKTLQRMVTDIPELDIETLQLERSTESEFAGGLNLVRAYLHVHNIGVLSPMLGAIKPAQMSQNLLLSVYNFNSQLTPGLEPLFQDVLQLSLSLGVGIERVLELVLDKKGQESAGNITPGGRFYMSFRKILIQQVKFSYKKCLAMLLKESVRNDTARLLLVAVLEEYKQGDKITRGSFVNELLVHFRELRPCYLEGSSVTDKQYVISMIHKLLILDKEAVLSESQPAYQFIVDVLFSFLACTTPDGAVLRSHALVLVPFILESPVATGLHSRLIDSLTSLVTSHLLVREADLPPGSKQRSDYLKTLNLVTEAVVTSKNLSALDVLFPFLQNPTDLAAQPVSEALRAFAQDIGDQRFAAFNFCLDCMRDGGKLPRLRKAIMDQLLVPLIVLSPPEAVAEWYVQHVRQLMDVLGRHVSSQNAEAEQESLLMKIHSYTLLELLFTQVQAQLIKDRITPTVSNQQVMKPASNDCRAKNDPKIYSFPENAGLWRELHVSAYTCLAAVVMCTQTQEKIFAVLFKDAGGNPLWQHLIDCSKVYSSFPVQTKTLSDSHAIVKGIRASFKERRGHQGAAGMTLSSQYLVGMSQEPTVISTFVGANSMASLPDEETQSEAVTVEEVRKEEESVVELTALDQDDFDQHPCMGMILKLIDHLTSKFGGTGGTGMPEWMKSLHATLDNSSTHANIRLFLGKVIVKARKAFTKFAGSFFQPLVSIILHDPQNTGGFSFHYVLRDFAITVLQWDVREPAENFTATRFVNHLIAVAAHESSAVLKANVEIIKALIDIWKGRVDIDGRGILNYLQAGGKTISDRQLAIQKSVGLQLFGAAVASSSSFTEALDRLGILKEEIYDILLSNLKVKAKVVYMASAEVLGMALKEKGDADVSAIEAKFKQFYLATFKEGDHSKCLHVMDRISYQFPPFVGIYIHLLIDLLPRLHGVSKYIALDILLRDPACVLSYFNMISAFICKLLAHRDAKAQLKALQLLTETVKQTADQTIVGKIVAVTCESSEHYETEECRLQFYQLLMFLHETKKVPFDTRVKRFLIKGLCDSSEAVRQQLQKFWDSQLPESLLERFSHILNNMHLPEFESHWTQFTDVLLLQLCRRSVDYQRHVFNAPLSDCEFFERQIDSSAQGGSLPMTPLFSQATSQRSGTRLADSTLSQASVSVVNQGRGGMIRATVGYSPATMTMFESGSEDFLSQSQGTQESSQAVGAVVDPHTRLKRRLYYAKETQSSTMRNVLNATRKRKAMNTFEVLDRANKVQIMRQYRTGELPDIEIKHEDLIGPMSSLAERDSTFARLLLSLTFGAFWQKNTIPANAKSEVQRGLETALETTRNDSTLVGTLQELCLHDEELWIKASVVGKASFQSQNFHSGIVLLEKEIHHGTKPTQAAKKHKGNSGEASADNMEAWVELARLYKAIGDNDVVLSLYLNRLTEKAVTHQALEAQVRDDTDRALMLYDKAIESGNVSKLEEELWYNQRLSCLADLSKWPDVMEDALLQVQKDNTEDYELEKFWHPKLQDPYLGLFVKGSIKVPSNLSLLNEFLRTSLEDSVRRSFLLQHFGTELATVAVLNDETDRARYYVAECYKSFRRAWSVLHPLATGARRSQISALQKIAELEEFVEFSTRPEWSNVQRLFKDWRQRWPSPEKDSIQAWDDILQNRLLFFQKLQTLFNQQPQATGNFAKELDMERACGFYEAARGLMKRGAYSVAQKYLNEYMAVNQRVSEKGSFHTSFFKRLVKLRCLQALRTQENDRNSAVTMLEQVLDYVRNTAKRPGISNHADRSRTLKRVESDVCAQLGLSRLELLMDKEDGALVNQSLTMFGSAYRTYFELQETTDGLSTHEIAKSSFKFACFCDDLLRTADDSKWSPDVRRRVQDGSSSSGLPPASALPETIVSAMLRTLSLDSSIRPEQAVARVLSLVGEHEETHRSFNMHVDKVASWIFLGWLPQILASMDKNVGELFVRILEDIASSYPQALYFPFHVSKSEYGPVGQERTRRLATLLKSPVFEGLIRALEDLTFPEKRLYDGLSQIKGYLASGEHAKAQGVFQDVYADCLDVEAMKGSSRQAGEYNIKFAKDFSKAVSKALGENGNKLLQMDEKKFATSINSVLANLQKAIKELPGGKLSLSSFSKWMANFDQPKNTGRNVEVEIPGQYDGFHKPDVSSHVTLVGFDETLVALSSKQRPKILTMRGSDEKEYKFIVKGGEDLRLDQRIEQLFSVMNSVLKQDSACAQRKLSIKTYSVIPVSKQCGLLQFVDNTCVLEDVIKDGISCKLPQVKNSSKDKATELLNSLRGQHHQWVEKKGASKVMYDCYKNLYTKAKPQELEQRMASLTSQLPWDALKTGLYRRTTSAESFLTMRSQFGRSLAVVSICGYVAGVGDRHLANTLVDMQTGSLVSIDFGYSFGTGVILLPVPELIPFRLTPQLTNVLLPLDSLGLLKNDMVRAMSALQKNREMISAVMDVFVKEPLVDWKNEASKTKKNIGIEEEGESSQQVSHEQQHVQLKVENAERKLKLWNPAEVTVSELGCSVHAGKAYLAAMEAAVRGESGRKRSMVKRTVCGSVEEQVECLIDQATDPCLLGRLWVGWQSWV